MGERPRFTLKTPGRSVNNSLRLVMLYFSKNKTLLPTHRLEPIIHLLDDLGHHDFTCIPVLWFLKVFNQEKVIKSMNQFNSL